MCLGIPGRVTETFLQHEVLMGKVDFGGVSKQVCLNLTPEVEVGQYVIVHVGFALQVIDEAEAEKVFEFLRNMDDLEELDTDQSDSKLESTL
ncbi:Hydrogenase isoenzymes formation protein HypC [Novipirellula galeiformis]|uniref:Hydrogenase isoenzymes formation protein HypC n=1 Tax=Novipirellula galeiformis TaxID=2528004 RepID=A0A5C6CGA8_9BACT|nr:HypC/HybG/HupF family hydrogenase formation chaperone [Novipirellula galeiformis]TWU22311.1 Hydrogenase isoenzymes formation protein HypC [Novipirellula galeiformis]